ncbi:hypothetical protein WHR41_08602 [Cladosporium halotolerans]|uniref:Conserved oligomeric Golgi complex subunit 6 n=1 Tax=Cladosporium halotolerans TaxID=1052096 RepID=A0AB34KG57_9PEZI
MATSYFPDRITSPPSSNAGGSALSPRSPSTPSALKSNALQNRITSVLSASYADLEIRDALNVFDERNLTNSAEARRNLRLDVQEELIQCNGEVVQDFGQVAQQLRRIGAAISSLNDSCAEMRKHISAANRETGPMLDEAKGILDGKAQVEGKKQLLDAFNDHFVLSEADQATLTSSTEPVNDEFFRVLTCVKKIHQDSQILLGSENQRLGLEILEQSSKQVNGAYQKLYRWVQREFKSLDLENPQISAGIRRALRVLAERPTLFQNCLDFFAEARENVLSNNFYAALTGAPVDQDHPVMGKAIELSAHDPLRYVGDMLAWAHSATVSEREALEVLFIADGDEIAKSIRAGIESEPWTRPDDDFEETPVFDGKRSLNQLVDRDLAGVFRQLKQRIEQVVQSHQDATLAYRISNLLTFYTTIFSALLSPSSALLATLSPLADSALRAFKTSTRDHLASLQTSTHPISPTDLAPPDFLTDALATLRTLMTSFETSHTTTSPTTAFDPILDEALRPYLAGCASLSRTLPSPHAQIFSLNCAIAALATLAPHATTLAAAPVEHLRAEIESHTSALKDATFDFLLSSSGLAPLLPIQDFRDKRDELAAAARKLDVFLPTATEDARGFLGQVGDRGVVRSVVEEAAERFCGVFEGVEGRVLEGDEMAEGDGEEDGEEEGMRLREVFPRTGGEIRVLLS